MTDLKLGIALWSQASDWSSFLAAAQAAERLGYDHVWTWDHIQAIFGDPDQPIFEGYTALAAVAQATERVGIGLFVGANTFRNPGLAVKCLTTIDHISGGRAIFGLGGAWFEHEHTSFGIDFGSGFGQRLDWLAEATAAAHVLLDGGEVTSPAGGRYAFDHLRTLPRPVQAHLPLMIGGGGEKKTLRIVAEHADMWNVFGTPDVLVHKDAILREHCADVGRDPVDDRALGRLQDHDPIDRGRGRTRPAGHPGAQPDAARARGGRRDVLDRHARADRRDDDRLPTDRLPHVPRRAPGTVRRRDDGDPHPGRQADGRGRPGRELTPTRRTPDPTPPGSGVSSATMRRVSTGRVFSRSTVPDPPIAVDAYGSTIRDADGREYLDAAGGAIVVNVGHGRREIAAAMADQAARLAYAHGSTFTSEPLEAYAREVARHLPIDDPAIYPVSGGSEAIETALKLARAYHLARGESERWIVYARWGSYHGNTLGALDLSGRKPLRRPYEGWLGRFRHVSAAYPYRDRHARRRRARQR